MDIEFGTDGWRTTTESFTGARIRAVGQAVVDHLRAAGEDAPVAVGYDPRAGSRSAAEELCRVLCAGGFDAIVPPRDTPTPIVAWTVTDRDLAGALQVTASHNPPTDNGIKFIPADGAPALPDVTDRLAAELKPPEPLAEPEWGSVEETDLIEPYIEHALAFVDADLEGRTIAYDGMHGSGRGVTNRLLARAGADVEARREDADPEFGGTAPEPTPEHLVDLAQMVENDGAELGIANDGDADRIAVVTPDRGVVDPNWLFAALYDYCLGTDDGDAVRTVSTTFLIDRIAEAHGQAVHETPVGFKCRVGSGSVDTSGTRTASSSRSPWRPPTARNRWTTGWTGSARSTATSSRTAGASTVPTTGRRPSSRGWRPIYPKPSPGPKSNG